MATRNTVHVSHRLHDFVLLFLLPFTYGAATRVPFVFTAWHCIHNLGTSLSVVGFVLGAYQASRVAGNLLVTSPLGPRRAHLVGVAAGLLGYLALAVNDAQSMNAGQLAFWLGWVGLSEQIAALQDACKSTYSTVPLLELRQRFKLQYACNVGGTSFAFVSSGLLFSTYGVPGSAWLGAGLEATHLAGALLYYLMLQRIPTVHTHGQPGTSGGITGLLPAASVKRQGKRVAFAGQVEVMGGEGLAKDAVLQATEDVGLEHAEEDTTLLHPICSLMLPDIDMTTLRHDKSLKRMETITQRAALLKAASGLKQQEHAVHAVKAAAGDGGSSSGGDGSDDGEDDDEEWRAVRHAPWINYVLAVTFGMQALMIGVVLSTAPLYLYGQHGFSVWQIGALMAGGEAVGTALLISLSTQQGEALFHRTLPMPLNLLCALCMLGLASVTVASKREAVSAASMVVIMAINDVATCLSAETQGATLPFKFYRSMNVLGNSLRRLGNFATSVGGPVLFGFAAWLPFVSLGSLLLAWTSLLAVMFGIRAEQLSPYLSPAMSPDGNAGGDELTESAARGSNGSATRRPNLLLYHKLSFVSMETRARMRMAAAGKKSD